MSATHAADAAEGPAASESLENEVIGSLDKAGGFFEQKKEEAKAVFEALATERDEIATRKRE